MELIVRKIIIEQGGLRIKSTHWLPPERGTQNLGDVAQNLHFKLAGK